MEEAEKPAVRIFVDADACPVKSEIYRVAERYALHVYVVANAFMAVPRSELIERVIVAEGPDAADDWIAERATEFDIVVTADIPLAAAALAKGGRVLDPRGEIYTNDNIEARLTMRKFMDELRAGGVDTGGPPPFNHGDRQAFARQLERLLAPAATAEFAPKPPPAGA